MDRRKLLQFSLTTSGLYLAQSGLWPASVMAWTGSRLRKGRNRPRSALSVCKDLGLTSGLKLCLDAGDSSSYSGSGQSWLDTSGSSTNFYLGATSSTESSDPTFNGVAGKRSVNEYFSLAGANYFTLSSSNPSWVDSLHQAGAQFSIGIWIYIGSVGSTQQILSTAGSGTGITLGISSAGNYFFNAYNAGTVVNTYSLNLPGDQSGSWHFCTTSIVATGGSTGSYAAFGRPTGVTSAAYDGTYSSPSSSTASNVLRIGANAADATNPVSSGTRLGMLALWQGSSAPGANALLAFYNATRARYGV